VHLLRGTTFSPQIFPPLCLSIVLTRNLAQLCAKALRRLFLFNSCLLVTSEKLKPYHQVISTWTQRILSSHKELLITLIFLSHLMMKYLPLGIVIQILTDTLQRIAGLLSSSFSSGRLRCAQKLLLFWQGRFCKRSATSSRGYADLFSHAILSNPFPNEHMLIYVLLPVALTSDLPNHYINLERSVFC
jgi:hypothetical protein